MPPKSTKRKAPTALQEADANQVQTSAAKRPKKAGAAAAPVAKTSKKSTAKAPAASKSKKGTAATDSTRSSAVANTTISIPKTKPHRRSGPKGAAFLPNMFPIECQKQVEKMAIPASWIQGFDATPDREYTLGDYAWWMDNLVWLTTHKAKLGLKEKHWMMPWNGQAKDRTKETEGRLDSDVICIARPHWDSRAEKQGNSDDSEDESEGEESEGEESEGEGVAGRKAAGPKPAQDEEWKKFIGEFGSLHPEYVWKFTMLGHDRLWWWVHGSMLRDQDEFGMYIYNDFTSYGQMENFENIFIQVAEVLKPKTLKAETLWPEIEGLALFVNSSYLDPIYMADDGQRVTELVELYGHLVLHCLDLFTTTLATEAASLPNLGLVFALLIRWAWDFRRQSEDFSDEVTWMCRAVELADAHGVTLAGPYGFDKILETIRAQAAAYDGRTLTKHWGEKGEWKKKKMAYSRNYGPMGGDQYDITKMSAAERRAKSFL